MTDIVELLRSGYVATNFAHLKAADEIERNREAISELVDALQSAVNQVEYMHRKFQETGSGNGFIAQWTQLISKHDTQPTKKGSN